MTSSSFLAVSSGVFAALFFVIGISVTQASVTAGLGLLVVAAAESVVHLIFVLKWLIEKTLRKKNKPSSSPNSGWVLLPMMIGWVLSVFSFAGVAFASHLQDPTGQWAMPADFQTTSARTFGAFLWYTAGSFVTSGGFNVQAIGYFANAWLSFISTIGSFYMLIIVALVTNWISR